MSWTRWQRLVILATQKAAAEVTGLGPALVQSEFKASLISQGKEAGGVVRGSPTALGALGSSPIPPLPANQDW